MNKKIALVLVLLLFSVVFWRMTSRTETKFESSQSSVSRNQAPPTPTAAQAAKQIAQSSKSPAEAPAVLPHSGFDPRAAAMARFAKKSGGLENQGAPLVPGQALSKIRKSKSKDINGRGYQILEARAVPKSDYRPSMGEALYEQSGFTVIPMSQDLVPHMNDLTWRESDRPVLVAPNGRVAMVTGTLIVKLKDMSAAERVAASERLTIAARDEDINVVYLRPPSEYGLLAGQARLRAQADVERVEIELVQSRKAAK